MPIRPIIAHRREREAQILECIGSGVERIADMVPKMYQDTPEFMYPAAARSVLAAMEYLVQRGEVISSDGVSMDAAYRLGR